MQIAWRIILGIVALGAVLNKLSDVLDIPKNLKKALDTLTSLTPSNSSAPDMPPPSPAPSDFSLGNPAWPSLHWERYHLDVAATYGTAAIEDHSESVIEVNLGRLTATADVPRSDSLEMLNRLIEQRVRSLRVDSFVRNCKPKEMPGLHQVKTEGTTEDAGADSDDAGEPTSSSSNSITTQVYPGFVANGIASLLIEETERCSVLPPSATYYQAINFDLNTPSTDLDPPSLGLLRDQGLRKCQEEHIEADKCVWFLADEKLRVTSNCVALSSFDAPAPQPIFPETPFAQLQKLMDVDLLRRLSLKP